MAKKTTSKTNNSASRTADRGKSKSTAAKKTARQPEKNVPQQTDGKKNDNHPLVPWILALIALLIIISFFINDNAVFGNYVTPALRGVFGGTVFALPVYLLLIALFWNRDRKNSYSATKYALCVANWIFLSIVVQMLTTTPEQRAFWQDASTNFLYVFYSNGEQLIGAGALGGTIGTAFESFLGYWACIILSIPLTVISFIFLCGTTPIRMIRKIAAFFGELRLPSDPDEDGQPENDEPPAPVKPATRQKPAKKEGKPPVSVDVDIDGPVMTEPKPESRVDVPIPEEERPFDYRKIFSEEKPAPAVIRESGDYEKEAELDIVPDDAQSDAAEDKPVAEHSPVNSGSTDTPPYVFPPITLLTEGGSDSFGATPSDITRTSEKLVETLASFGVRTRIINTSCGPSVTRYELQPESGVKVKAIANLADDIALHLAATSIRMECPIPGKSAVGIELPNKNVSTVRLRDLIANHVFRDSKEKLLVCLGVDVGGNPIYLNIAKMPHLLVAGATGMGKSVCINSMIVSLLYRARPDEVKLILIDPKKIEFSDYNGIPHLLVPVVTEPKKAAGTLNWAVNEMEKRFSLFAQVGARELAEYNDIIKDDPERESIPSVVIIIDELADLMMTAPDEVETSICRLAQKARAAGMHLIIGTQRPSVDVITGLIKANVPSRIACTVASQVDSRTILDMAGAEKLMGRGDMLYSPVGSLKPIRVQGAFVDGKNEVTAVCQFIKDAAGASYNEEVMSMIEQEAMMCGEKHSKRSRDDGGAADIPDKDDPMLLEAIEVAFESGTVSTSLLQRRLSLGYSRAARIVDTLERRGIVGSFDPATKKRSVLISKEQLLEMKLNAADKEREDESEH